MVALGAVGMRPITGRPYRRVNPVTSAQRAQIRGRRKRWKTYDVVGRGSGRPLLRRKFVAYRGSIRDPARGAERFRCLWLVSGAISAFGMSYARIGMAVMGRRPAGQGRAAHDPISAVAAANAAAQKRTYHPPTLRNNCYNSRSIGLPV